MNTPLNDTTQQKARDLARQITVAHDLDPDIQEELYGHIEDKLLAYKSGEERISDEDAFILVREHFGDAKVLRGLLQEVHAGEVQVGQLRRLLAIVAITLGMNFAVAVAGLVAALLLFFTRVFPAYATQYMVRPFVELPILLGAIYVLYRCKRPAPAEKARWYCRWPIPKTIVWLCLLAALNWALPAVVVAQSSMTLPPTELFLWVYMFGSTAAQLGSCLLWLWWSHCESRRASNVALWSCLWFIYSASTLIPPAKLCIILGPETTFSAQFPPFFEGYIGDTPLAGSMVNLGQWLSLGFFGLGFAALAVHAGLCYLLVITWNALRNRYRVGSEYAGIPV